MTEQKYKEYERLYKEIRPLKDFLSVCGDEFRDKENCRFIVPFRLNVKSIKVQHKSARRFDYERGIGEYEIPASIQRKIVALVEEYVEQKEEEMRNL